MISLKKVRKKLTNVLGISDVVDAIHKEKSALNKSREKINYFSVLLLNVQPPHPESSKFQILLTGIQATHGVSYIRTIQPTTFTLQSVQDGE